MSLSPPYSYSLSFSLSLSLSLSLTLSFLSRPLSLSYIHTLYHSPFHILSLSLCPLWCLSPCFCPAHIHWHHRLIIQSEAGQFITVKTLANQRLYVNSLRPVVVRVTLLVWYINQAVKQAHTRHGGEKESPFSPGLLSTSQWRHKWTEQKRLWTQTLRSSACAVWQVIYQTVCFYDIISFCCGNDFSMKGRGPFTHTTHTTHHINTHTHTHTHRHTNLRFDNCHIKQDESLMSHTPALLKTKPPVEDDADDEDDADEVTPAIVCVVQSVLKKWWIFI